MKTEYANIIIDIVHEKLDRVFQYRIPPQLLDVLKVGMEVEIPFGKSNRLIRGFVIECTQQAEYEEDKIKDIIRICDSPLKTEMQMIQLAAWIHENYGSTMIQALKTVLPVRERVREVENRSYELAVTQEEALNLLEKYTKKNAVAKVRLLQKLIETRQLSYDCIKNELKISLKTLEAMCQENVLSEKVIRIYRNPFEGVQPQRKPYILNKQQQQAVDIVVNNSKNDIQKNYLLYGITGSGKTEVYIEIIAEAVKRKQQAIVLIPEIALTYQTVLRFYHRFGTRVSVIHSRLSKGEKYDQFQRAQNGDLDVVIGPRSALFTPFSNLGIIIIDEEHEMGYKSETVPKYDARETAIARANICGASVVFGSATPSLETYAKTKTGVYELLSLPERISSQGLANVCIEDMREEMREGNRSVFSRRLRSLIQERLARREQILLFLNRRGYAGFVSCRSCGKSICCPHCDVSLSLHRNGKMICHYCGYEQPNVKTCPTCGSKYVGGFRVGTEQVEEIVSREFPQAKVLRMDMDTTRAKHGHEQIVNAFANHEADILIGTQMIVKGHDFPKVTLVGVLAADMSLQAVDYRAAERTFQLLTQAAGRAGRGTVKGEVVIQTYNPEHYAIVLAANQDYEAFYEEEMRYRSMMLYPPAGSILEIFLSGEQEEVVCAYADKIKELVEQMLYKTDGKCHLIGPAPAVIAKLNDRYRRVLYLKSLDRSILITIRKCLEKNADIQTELQLQFDISGF